MITLEKVLSEMKSESLNEVVCGNRTPYGGKSYVDDNGNGHEVVWGVDDNDTPDISYDDDVYYDDKIVFYSSCDPTNSSCSCDPTNNCCL